MLQYLKLYEQVIGHFRVPKINPHFQNEARYTNFLVKMSFICMKMKNDFNINGWAPTLVLEQRPGRTRKWPIDTVWPFNTVKTIEKVPLGLRKWWPRTLNRVDRLIEANRGRNYSTSREVIFGTLKTDRFIEGGRLIRCRLIHVRL